MTDETREATKVAVAQLTSNDDVDQNMAAVARCVRRAAEAGAQLVVIPECFSFLGPEQGKLAIAESIPGEGPLLKRCRALAEDHGIEVIYGGFWEKAGDGRILNASMQIHPDGSLGAVYRKIHLFDVDLADGTRLCESATVAPGETLVVADSVAGRVGLSVCYDLRFPELYRGLVDQGATVLTVPAAFTLMTGKDHWEVLLRARAIEQQCYVLAAAQTGRHVQSDGSGRRESWGHAMIVDPWGVVLAQCGAGEGVAVAQIDQAEVQRIRRQLPSLQHRRL